MSEKTVKKLELSVGPFGVRIDAPVQKDFDKYYVEYEKKDVFKSSGEIDPETGEELGVIVTKFIERKIDIEDLLASQADSVGVESYIKALMVQGVDINDFNTVVRDDINDFSQCPDNLADSILIGDKARKAFENMDPALRGSHTTIEGFLNSLSQENIDNYIKGRVEALTPKTVVVKDGE